MGIEYEISWTINEHHRLSITWESTIKWMYTGNHGELAIKIGIECGENGDI